MPDIDEILTEVRKQAKKDPSLAARLLATRTDPQPVKAFCDCVTALGWPLSEMDLIYSGEEYYANMRRSTNGGGENSPLLRGSDDYYELFLSELKEFLPEA